MRRSLMQYLLVRLRFIVGKISMCSEIRRLGIYTPVLGVRIDWFRFLSVLRESCTQISSVLQLSIPTKRLDRMSSSKRDPTVYDRIQSIEIELKALVADALQDEKARKMLIGVSQHTINTLETGPDAIWRIVLQVFNHKAKSSPSDLECKLFCTLVTLTR